MINSLFMLGSSYNKNRKISIAFIIGWIAYMFIGSDLTLGATFPIVNAIVFLSLSVIINLIKNKKANTILSICSILIWSIVMDIICYFAFPMLVGNQNIFGYILQGIAFNYKYIFSNIVAIGIIYALDMLIDRIVILVKTKENAII